MFGVYVRFDDVSCFLSCESDTRKLDTVSGDNDLLHSSWRSSFRWRLDWGGLKNDIHGRHSVTNV